MGESANNPARRRRRRRRYLRSCTDYKAPTLQSLRYIPYVYEHSRMSCGERQLVVVGRRWLVYQYSISSISNLSVALKPCLKYVYECAWDGCVAQDVSVVTVSVFLFRGIFPGF